MIYNKHNLAVARVASKDENRPELSGVFFTKDKTVATDSFKLLEISVPNVQEDNHAYNFQPFDGKPILKGIKPFIISAEMLRDKMKLKEHEMLGVKHIYDNRVEFASQEEFIAIRHIAGKYPDYQKIFPTKEPKATVTVNAKYLCELLQVLGELGPNNNEIKISVYDQGESLVIEAGDKNQKGRGLLAVLNK